MKEKLLEYCYKNKKEYIYDVGQREFDCLIFLVEEGSVNSFEALKEYGMDYETETAKSRSYISNTQINKNSYDSYNRTN